MSKTARLRNRMLDALELDKFDYILWIDAGMIREIPPINDKMSPDDVFGTLILLSHSNDECNSSTLSLGIHITRKLGG